MLCTNQQQNNKQERKNKKAHTGWRMYLLASVGYPFSPTPLLLAVAYAVNSTGKAEAKRMGAATVSVKHDSNCVRVRRLPGLAGGVASVVRREGLVGWDRRRGI